MTSKQIREKYIKFFVDKRHKEIAPAKLVPENDPTTLFTSSGMQPLVPYLLGQEHPEGKRLVNSQPSFRAEDIEEVGDNRHTTFFEMLGNWSLGDYFKEDQLRWFWEFLTKEIKLDPNKLYVSVFEGNKDVPKDNESYEIWKSLGVAEDHIFFYGVGKNWWSRSGTPDKMPEGEIGGPDSEVFYDFGTPHDEKYGEKCHPNCDCGRFLEIGNSVFIQYQKQEDGSLKELSQKNVDFGGGLERLAAATNDNPDIFEIDIFSSIKQILEEEDLVSNKESQRAIRIVLDHIRASIFLIYTGVVPGNKEQGYILRRLIRRATLYSRLANMDLSIYFGEIIKGFTEIYKEAYPELDSHRSKIWDSLDEEITKFNKTLEVGMRLILSRKGSRLNGKDAFNYYQTYGYPLELTRELALQHNIDFTDEGFDEALKEHQEKSRTASAGMFKGGLADHSETVIKYHTATHLLHQALRDILGPQVFQKGSNITSERLRFDFSYDKKMTDEEIKKTEEIINQRIEEDLKVDRIFMLLEKAKEMNAIGLFNDKYAKEVSIYGVGPNFELDADAKDQRDRGGYYSLEFCGGPHVEYTGVIGKIKIVKEEAISSGMRRIRAEIVLR
ncbi:alanine--tRNA ligase [Candidatus Daviesbacteria bacterium]|nr:alanine--tRNA ligase [Candidatus Daviesbacteria bacterium]